MEGACHLLGRSRGLRCHHGTLVPTRFWPIRPRSGVVIETVSISNAGLACALSKADALKRGAKPYGKTATRFIPYFMLAFAWRCCCSVFVQAAFACPPLNGQGTRMNVVTGPEDDIEAVSKHH